MNVSLMFYAFFSRRIFFRRNFAAKRRREGEKDLHEDKTFSQKRVLRNQGLAQRNFYRPIKYNTSSPPPLETNQQTSAHICAQSEILLREFIQVIPSGVPRARIPRKTLALNTMRSFFPCKKCKLAPSRLSMSARRSHNKNTRDLRAG